MSKRHAKQVKQDNKPEPMNPDDGLNELREAVTDKLSKPAKPAPEPMNPDDKVKELDNNGKATIDKATQELIDSAKTDRQKLLDLQSQMEEIKARSCDRVIKLQKSDGVKQILSDIREKLELAQSEASKLITDYQAKIDSIAGYEQEISYYTGIINGIINPIVKGKRGQVKSTEPGKFTLTINEDNEEDGTNGLDVGVKYNVTNELFEFYLESKDNKVQNSDWKALRTAITEKLSKFPELVTDNGHGKNYEIRKALKDIKPLIMSKRVIAQ